MIKKPKHKLRIIIEGETIEDIRETLLKIARKFGWMDANGQHVINKRVAIYTYKWKKEKVK